MQLAARVAHAHAAPLVLCCARARAHLCTGPDLGTRPAAACGSSCSHLLAAPPKHTRTPHISHHKGDLLWSSGAHRPRVRPLTVRACVTVHPGSGSLAVSSLARLTAATDPQFADGARCYTRCYTQSAHIQCAHNTHSWHTHTRGTMRTQYTLAMRTREGALCVFGSTAQNGSLTVCTATCTF